MLANFCIVDYGITGMRTLGEENTCQKDEELREPNMLQVVTLHSITFQKRIRGKITKVNNYSAVPTANLLSSKVVCWNWRRFAVLLVYVST